MATLFKILSCGQVKKNQTIQLANWQIEIWEKEWESSQLKIFDRELLKIFPEAKPYLREKLQNYLAKIERLGNIIKESLLQIERTKADKFTNWFRKEIIKVFFGEDYNQTFKKAKRLVWLLKPPAERKEEITSWMIERAKEYPMRDLILLNRSQFAVCPFHKERHASLYCRNNFYHCFACGETGDTIKFVMKTQGLSFKEAVKYLQ